MPSRKKFTDECEIPVYLKEKQVSSLPLANKWQNYMVEGSEKNSVEPRCFAWLKFRCNFRQRREGWIKAVGQWSVPDKNDFADLIWGIWHACKRKHFPSEEAWLDNFIKELIKVRNSILVRDVEEDKPDAKELEAYLEDEDPPAFPSAPVVIEKTADNMDDEEDEVVTARMVTIPPAEEDDGSDDLPAPLPKKKFKRKT